MKVRAQVAMVMNLDKCIGCHTCSVTCKNVWTNRRGVEYAWFNDVETKPGIGYPKRWEDQDERKGGWEIDRKGRLELKSGARSRRLFNIFFNPDLPTMHESGVPGFDVEPWYGLSGPAGLPARIVERINRETVEVLRSGAVKDRFTNNGLEARPTTPQEFEARIRTDIPLWTKTMRDAGMKAE